MPSVTPMSSLLQERQAMTTLLDLLQQEQRHLVAADIDALVALTAEKSALVSQMAVLANQRHGALGAAGFGAQDSDMEGWIAASGEAQAAPLWQQLLDMTHEAKELNRVNGMLINKHMSRTQGALNILRPQSQATNFYGPSGHATSSNPSRGFIVG